MRISVMPDDHWRDPRNDTRNFHRIGIFASIASSIVLNAAFVLAMILEGRGDPHSLTTSEISVELLTELPSLEKPARLVVKSDAKNDIEIKLPKGFAAPLPNVADEERKLKAPQAEKTIEGSGADKVVSAPLPEAKADQDSDKPDPDPNKEISRIVPAAAPKPIAQVKPQTAPPGSEKKLARQRIKPDVTAKDNENAIKKKPIACGANATRSPPTMVKTAFGQVLRIMTEAEAIRSIEKNEAAHDLLVSPAYAHYTRLVVAHADDSRKTSTVIISPTLSTKIGDRVEVLTGRPDPSLPCHYIPAMIVRVL